MAINRTILTGTITNLAELRQLNKSRMQKFTLRIDEPYINLRTYETVNKSWSIDCELWGLLLDKYSNYLFEGNYILIDGRTKLDSWEDATGNKRYKHGINVQYLESFKEQAVPFEEAILGKDFNENPF